MIQEIVPSPTEKKQFLSFLEAFKCPDTTFIVQNTSGSTGKPKAIEIPKWKMEASAKMTGNFLHLSSFRSALLCISPNYIGGKMIAVRSLIFQLKMFLVPVNSRPLQHLDFPIDFAAMVPLQIEETLKHEPEKFNLLRCIIIGGAPLSEKIAQQLQAFDCAFYATFGMTETVSHIALRNLKQENASYVGTGNVSFETEDGCLTISSEELKIERLKTNDVVTLLDTKQFIWKGRADFVINSGGVKIHPEEVEQKIRSVFPSENTFVITSLPDERLGSKVVFVGTKEWEHADRLENKIAEIVAKYERPKAYFFIASIPQTPGGKVDRKATQFLIQKLKDAKG